MVRHDQGVITPWSCLRPSLEGQAFSPVKVGPEWAAPRALRLPCRQTQQVRGMFHLLGGIGLVQPSGSGRPSSTRTPRELETDSSRLKPIRISVWVHAQDACLHITPTNANLRLVRPRARAVVCPSALWLRHLPPPKLGLGTQLSLAGQPLFPHAVAVGARCKIR